MLSIMQIMVEAHGGGVLVETFTQTKSSLDISGGGQVIRPQNLNYRLI